MSDRTSVTLRILERDFKAHSELLDHYDEKAEQEVSGIRFVLLTFYECSEANIEIEEALAEAIVPYDKQWEATTYIRKGSEYGRVDASGHFTVKIFENGEEDTVRLDDLLLAKNEGRLEAFLSDAIAEKRFSWGEQITLLQAIEDGTQKVEGKVIIHEMEGQSELYSLHFEGNAEDFGFNDTSDYLNAEDAHEIALEVASETDSIISWEGMKPAWA